MAGKKRHVSAHRHTHTHTHTHTYRHVETLIITCFSLNTSSANTHAPEIERRFKGLKGAVGTVCTEYLLIMKLVVS